MPEASYSSQHSHAATPVQDGSAFEKSLADHRASTLSRRRNSLPQHMLHSTLRTRSGNAAITTGRRPTLTADFGLTEDAIEDAQNLLEEFQKRIGAPREAIGQRKVAGEEITRAIKEARALLKNRLDPLMRQFNIPGTTPELIANHLFHEAYQTARIIVDAPSKKKKPAEGGNGGGI